MTSNQCPSEGQHTSPVLRAACPVCNPDKTVPELQAAAAAHRPSKKCVLEAFLKYDGFPRKWALRIVRDDGSTFELLETSKPIEFRHAGDEWKAEATTVEPPAAPNDEQIDHAIRRIEECELSMDDSEGLVAMLTELKQHRATQPPPVAPAQVLDPLSDDPVVRALEDSKTLVAITMLGSFRDGRVEAAQAARSKVSILGPPEELEREADLFAHAVRVLWNAWKANQPPVPSPTKTPPYAGNVPGVSYEKLAEATNPPDELDRLEFAPPADKECSYCFGEGAVAMSNGYERRICTLCNGTGRVANETSTVTKYWVRPVR